MFLFPIKPSGDIFLIDVIKIKMDIYLFMKLIIGIINLQYIEISYTLMIK